ncbi:hypothetical protein HHI36_006245, partial [Cryptolaemus montrouzieri]
MQATGPVKPEENFPNEVKTNGSIKVALWSDSDAVFTENDKRLQQLEFREICQRSVKYQVCEFLILHLNIQGIGYKSHSIEDYLMYKNYLDILCLSEHFSNHSIPSEFVLEGWYTLAVFRRFTFELHFEVAAIRLN